MITDGRKQGPTVGRGAHTASIAFFTRSLLIRPFLKRLLTRAALVAPPENQAISAEEVYGRVDVDA